MGFGYLLIGYLLAFVLKLTVSQLGFGFLASLAGYALMIAGTWELKNYRKDFFVPQGFLYPLTVVAVFDGLFSLSELFLWQIPFLTPAFREVLDWSDFLLTVLFELSLLWGIRRLAAEVGLGSTVAAAARNTLFVGIYAALAVAVHAMPPESVPVWLQLSFIVFNVVYIACDLFLILSCDKNICPEGKEEPEPHRSRFALINKLNEKYDRNRQTAIDHTQAEAEEKLKRRREASLSKKKRKK